MALWGKPCGPAERAGADPSGVPGTHRESIALCRAQQEIPSVL